MIQGHFTAEFLKSLPQDQTEAFGKLADEFFAYTERYDFRTFAGDELEHPVGRDLKNLLAVAAVFRRVSELFDGPQIIIPRASGENEADALELYEYLCSLAKKWRKEFNIQNALSNYGSAYDAIDAVFSKESNYEFEDSDYSRVQELINELRDEIRRSPHLQPEHKSRLLHALEKTQKELHKKCSNVDAFSAFMWKLGEVARIFGQDLEPITKRAMEIGALVLKAFAVKKQLENGVPGDVLDTTKKFLQWP